MALKAWSRLRVFWVSIRTPLAIGQSAIGNRQSAIEQVWLTSIVCQIARLELHEGLHRLGGGGLPVDAGLGDKGGRAHLVDLCAAGGFRLFAFHQITGHLEE